MLHDLFHYAIVSITSYSNEQAIQEFLNALRTRLERLIERIVIIPLYGKTNEFFTVESALRFLDGHRIYEGSGDFRKYEILVSFSNGDRAEGSFKSKQKVKQFLQFVANQ